MRALLAATIICLGAGVIAPADAQAAGSVPRAAVHHHRFVLHHHRHHRLRHTDRAAHRLAATPAPVTKRIVALPAQGEAEGPFANFLGAGARVFGTAGHALAQTISGVYAKVTEAAIAAGVPVDIAHAVVKLESGYRTVLRGAAGEVGIMQVLPATAAAMGENPYSVDGNLRAGMKYLRLALDSSHDLCAAISGYNHGIGRRPYCTHYGRTVLAFAGASR